MTLVSILYLPRPEYNSEPCRRRRDHSSVPHGRVSAFADSIIMAKVTEHFSDGQDSSENTSITKSIDWEKITQPYVSFQQYQSRRSVVYGTKGGSKSSTRTTHSYLWPVGMVACSQPLAAEAGLEVLRKGGNAGKYCSSSRVQISKMNRGSASKADAAVAVSAALNVTEPSSCGLGGYVLCHLCERCTRTSDLTPGLGMGSAYSIMLERRK